MNKLNPTLAIVLTLVLTACGTVSDVVALNPETYLISSHGVIGNGAASAEEIKAVQTATAFCQQRSRELKVLSVEKVDPYFGRAPSASVRFHCITK